MDRDKMMVKERFGASVYLGLPSALPPHPSSGHLLPWGEGGEAFRFRACGHSPAILIFGDGDMPIRAGRTIQLKIKKAK